MESKNVNPSTDDARLMLEQLERYHSPQLGPWIDAEDFHESFGWTDPEITKTRNDLRDAGVLKIRQKNGRLQYRINFGRVLGRVGTMIDREASR